MIIPSFFPCLFFLARTAATSQAFISQPHKCHSFFCWLFSLSFFTCSRCLLLHILHSSMHNIRALCYCIVSLSLYFSLSLNAFLAHIAGSKAFGKKKHRRHYA